VINMFTKFKELLNPKNKNLTIISSVLFLIVGCMFLLPLLGKPKVNFDEHEESTKKASDVSVLGDDVNNQIFVKDMEKNYFELKQNADDLTGKVNANIKKLSDDQKFIGEYLEKLGNRLDELEKKLDGLNDSNKILGIMNGKSFAQNLLNNPSQPMKLEYVDIHPIEEKEIISKDIHLPMGSFCRATLMTGVHAPADETKPLPVLIRLDEAFVGPNHSRIPLKGTFVLGSAYGDIVSKRAYIEVYAISSVLPDGTSYEKSVPSFGYIGDENKEFGLEGEIVSTSGRDLGISFLSGFMSGAAQTFADAETTSVVTGNTITKAVTGNSVKNAAFQGLSSSAANLSEYYQKQIDKIVPSIRIKPGATVYFYVQKGITINGLKVDEEDSQFGFED